MKTKNLIIAVILSLGIYFLISFNNKETNVKTYKKCVVQKIDKLEDGLNFKYRVHTEYANFYTNTKYQINDTVLLDE